MIMLTFELHTIDHACSRFQIGVAVVDLSFEHGCVSNDSKCSWGEAIVHKVLLSIVSHVSLFQIGSRLILHIDSLVSALVQYDLLSGTVQLSQVTLEYLVYLPTRLILLNIQL